MDMRKMLKKADKWNWCNTILFIFGMITCTGYLIKHLMMIIFGVKARRLLKQKNDPFDPEVQKFWFLHRHAQEWFFTVRYCTITFFDRFKFLKKINPNKVSSGTYEKNGSTYKTGSPDYLAALYYLVYH